MNKNSLIFLSLNEINFDYVKKYLKFKKLHNLRKISDDLITTKSEEEYEKLEPWIQWPSVYTGKKAAEHNIFRLGDIIYFKEKTIFNEIEDLGLSTGAISSMNLNNNLKKPKYFIPDPWTLTAPDKSYWSIKIHATISKFVKNNANTKVNISDFISLFFILFKFARFKNYPLYIKFFLTSFKYKWRKALFLDLLLNDIHMKYFENNRPNFSNLFFNGMAHIQHHYFFNSKVIGNLNLKNPSWYLEEKKDPIEEGLTFYDRILGDYINNKNCKVAIATGLTQKPYDMIKFYYKIINHKLFFKKIQIEYESIQELMSRDFIIYFSSEEKAKTSEVILNNILLNDKKIFKIENRGKNLFVTMIYPYEITDKDYLNIGKIKLVNFTAFVAIKNGMHSEKGFYFDNFSNYKNKQMDLVNIKNLILNYFN